MKLKMKFVLLAGSLVLPSCGERGGVIVPKGGSLIDFQYQADTYNSNAYVKLVETYNSTQGLIDKVAVNRIKKTTSYEENANTTLTNKSAPNVIEISDRYFKKYATQGRFVSLEEYFAKDENVAEGVPADLLNRFRYDKSTTPYESSGEGQKLYALPNGNRPTVIYYNVDMFKNQGINVISVSEEKLEEYNSQNKSNYKAHGYAEYSLAPMSGLTSSKTLAGETVYKVFNNRIPMNWDELVYLSKYFTKGYNSASASAYGYLTEWWFSFGWSVGGDCIGWNEKTGHYDFTLGDDTPNYLVLGSLTLNEHVYKAGDLLCYSDKKALNVDFSYLSEDERSKLHKLPSQYDAFIRYNSLITDKNSYVADAGKGVKGEDVGYKPLGDRAKPFTSGTVAMVNDDYSMISRYKASSKINYDIAPLQQYRSYEGDIDNDGIVKIIGKDGYKGDLLTVNGTEIVGKLMTSSIAKGLMITKASDASKYEAAYKFIRWAAGTEGQKIMISAGERCPNQIALMEKETPELLENKNVDAVSTMLKGTSMGDWSYFDDGTWVSDWSTDLNSLTAGVRGGKMTLARFFELHQAEGDAALNKKNIHNHGRLADR